jgi:uncharacterized membrane protein YkvA (DUF1232 family)
LSEPRLEIDLRARDRRLYDRLRAKVASSEPGGRRDARDLILLLPDFVVLLVRLARDPRVPLGAKLIAAAGVAYTLSPIDLLPEALLGPIGLLDDLLIAAAALSRVINHVHPDLVAAHWPGRGSVLDSIQRVTRYAEDTFGKILTRLLGFERHGGR